MFNFGVSLHVGTLLGEPENDTQALLQTEFGNPQKLLAYLRREGVTSIEIRNARTSMPVERSVAAIRTAHNAGFRVSVHIAFQDCTGEAYITHIRSIISEMLQEQQSAIFIIHPRKNCEETIRSYIDWATAFSRVDVRCRLALENMRMIKPGTEHHRLVNIEKVIQNAPEWTRGICWDMGHYTYNVVTNGLRAESLPCDAILNQVIHTHIHHMYKPDLNTHFPLERENEAVCAYVAALRECNYAGIYNLELEPERFRHLMSPRAGFEQSIFVLKELMK